MTTDRLAPRLRRMRWWDVDAVHAVEQQLFPHDAWTPEMFWSELAGVPETRWYVVAELGDRLVGYAGLMVVPPEADVQTVAVAREAQRGGIGQRLLAALAAQARSRGCRTLMLEVAADNTAAQRMYLADGFETVARRSRYYPDGTDAIVMRRRLSAEVPGD